MATEEQVSSPNEPLASNEGAVALTHPPPAQPVGHSHVAASLWDRIKRHKVVEWTLAYAAFAFALLHGVTLVVEALDWPHFILRLLTLVLVVGLPIAPILAWYHGVRALKRVSGAELLIVSLLLVIGGAWLWRSSRSENQRAASVTLPATAAAAPAAQGAASAFAPPPHSIAVLPFANMSGDVKEEYFSDGVSEELLDSLSHLNELHVAARTSSFSFKGQSVDIAVIARKLNVGNILEGSVRKSGNTVRVTAQLIDTVSGFHVWSKTYDRKLGDILKVQTDVAEAVTKQLQLGSSVAFTVQFELGNTQNPDAYDAYLRGLQMEKESALRTV